MTTIIDSRINMKVLSTFLLGLLLAAPLFAKKQALLIGVSNYPVGSGWCSLNAHNDVVLLDKVLSSEWDITILEDEEATHNGIVVSLSRFADLVSPGDTVYIHFSGHGQQMLPIEADTIHDPDMLDEAIIPYDAKINWAPNYKGQYHLRDNEFGSLIDAIRNKSGCRGLVIVVLDACHSDSMQRVSGTLSGTTEGYRGTSDIFGEIITDEDVKKRFNRDTSKIEIGNNAAVVYLSACQANSSNAEYIRPDGVGFGSLSYAVAGALMDVGVKDMNAFLDRVVMAMDTLVPCQIPGIRATFDYQRPDIIKVVTPIASIEEKEKSHFKFSIIAIAAALALFLVVLWRKRR